MNNLYFTSFGKYCDCPVSTLQYWWSLVNWICPVDC